MNTEISGKRRKMKKGFTLIELVVAIAILAMVSGFAGVIFNVSVGSHRTALANTEIMQKLRAITDQLDRDFEGFRKDGEIFVAWSAISLADPFYDYDYDDDYDGDGHVRFDRIMFFAAGDFQSYGTGAPVRGNVARICYMLAKEPGTNMKAYQQQPQMRVLARTQHILTADAPSAFVDPNTLTFEQLDEWNNFNEYDEISMNKWKTMRWETDKKIALSAITDVIIDDTMDPRYAIGAKVAPYDSNSIHNLWCEGVGEFKVQGWYAPDQRWVPEVDPDRNGNLADTDFLLDPEDSTKLHPSSVPGVLYPYRRFATEEIGEVILGGSFLDNRFRELLNQERFDEIPGLGRALKFTFTLYDSRGIITEGRTFTHIVYIGD